MWLSSAGSPPVNPLPRTKPEKAFKKTATKLSRVAHRAANEKKKASFKFIALFFKNVGKTNC